MTPVPWVDRRVGETHTLPVRAYLLIDHGSRRSEANELVGEVATRVKERLGSNAIVEAAHMELAEPTIQQAFARCVEQGATLVAVHPFMLAPGRHVHQDLPRLVAEAASAHVGIEFVMVPPLGAHVGVIDAVVDRFGEALARDR